jgi:hypothetical protein
MFWIRCCRMTGLRVGIGLTVPGVADLFPRDRLGTGGSAAGGSVSLDLPHPADIMPEKFGVRDNVGDKD